MSAYTAENAEGAERSHEVNADGNQLFRGKSNAWLGVVGLAGIAVLLSLWFTGSPRRVSGWTGGLVDSAGVYLLPNGDVLRVTAAGSGQLAYSLTDSTGRLLLPNDSAASVLWYSPSILFIDQQGRLWSHSFDVGAAYVWIPGPKGYELQVVEYKSMLARELPDEFVARMEQSSRDAYRRSR